MSVTLMAVAFRTSLPPTRKLVLLALCDAANDIGECYPSVSHLRGKCSLSERTVQAAIQELEQGGYLHRQQRAGRSTVYLLTPDLSTPPQLLHPRSRRTPAARAPTPATAAPPPPQQLHPTPATAAPITVTEPSVEPSPKREQRARAPEPGNAPAPTAAGLACRAMREAGLADTNPGDPRLLALLQQGATVEELRGVAVDAVRRGAGWAWALKALQGRRADAAAIALAPRDNGDAGAAQRVAETAAYLARCEADAAEARTPEADAARRAAMARVGRPTGAPC